MDTDPGSIILKIVTLFALIFVNAFFSMSEMAIVTLNDNKIDKMAEQGNKKAKQIKKLTENTDLPEIYLGCELQNKFKNLQKTQVHFCQQFRLVLHWQDS